MTETIESTAAATKKRAGGLNSMLLADLKAMAGGMGISGAGSMKKAQLVDAIKTSQSGGSTTGTTVAGATGTGTTGSGTARTRATTASSTRATTDTTTGDETATAPRKTPDKASTEFADQPADRPVDPTGPGTGSRTGPRTGTGSASARTTTVAQPQQPEAPTPSVDNEAPRHEVKTRTRGGASRAATQPTVEVTQQETAASRDRVRSEQAPEQAPAQAPEQAQRPDRVQQTQPEPAKKAQAERAKQPQQQSARKAQPEQVVQPEVDHGDQGDLGDDEGRTGRNRRRRGRDRNRVAGAPATAASASVGSLGGQRNEPDTTIHDDDVLVPAAGILDVLDNYAFVRTSGYLPGVDDVYVSLSMVRKFGLRRGDAIVGQVRQPREGERKEKFNPMVRIDSVNGGEPSQSLHRVEFAKLTPISPTDRLRLETGPDNLIGRVIDVVAPIGKGQRGLIVSPARAGRTAILASIADSIAANNPECHLMVVLVDERPEEVTEFQRSVKGEVISSTFDRPPADHTIVAELAIERAKRLVELGHDVVLLLDGITRLGRAYNLTAPASGRVLAGGVDAAALHPPKRFFGAARNIEDGGSLTILATALVETGSTIDEVIFEEFKGTGNLEIRLRREFADGRLFPAIDAVQSGTRREELLMSSEELAIVWKLRRVLSSLDGKQGLELLLERLRKSQTNIEFLMQVQKSTPTPGGND